MSLRGSGVAEDHALITLYEELRTRTYRPSSSICFIIRDPKTREVFVSSFRDRVVHHLYYNYVAAFCDRHFIYDSYLAARGGCDGGAGGVGGVADRCGMSQEPADGFMAVVAIVSRLLWAFSCMESWQVGE